MTIPEATRIVGQSQGLPDSFDGSVAAVNALGMDAKLALTDALGAYIKNNPSLFTSQQVGVANSMASQDAHNTVTLGAALQDTSFDVEAFFNDAGNNAYNLVAKPLVTLGNNIGTAATIAAVILPFGLLALGGWLIWTRSKNAILKGSALKISS